MNTNFTTNPDPILRFRRHTLKHFPRYFFLIIVLGMNISMWMSVWTRLHSGFAFDLGQEAIQFAFLLMVDLYLLPTLVLEVNSLGFANRTLIVGALLWRSKIPYESLRGFWMPKYLAFAVLRTPRCFYLIRRKDLGDFDRIMDLMVEKIVEKKY